MAVLHDFQCETCDRTFEHVVDAAILPVGPPCPTCQCATIRVFLPPRVTWSPDAVVVYRAPDGSFRFPGDTRGASTAKYDALGYERIEARGAAEVRHLETRMNRTERAHMERRTEHEQARREAGESLRRSDLRGRMQSMSRMGRDVARAAMRRTDAAPKPRTRDPGIHVECYSNNRNSGRE